MRNRVKTMSEYEFFQATGLFGKARDKFEELGIINPGYRSDERLYSPDEANLVCTVKSHLVGNCDLKTAYEKAVQELLAKAA